MTADDFVAQLQAAAPRAKDLQRVGLSRQEAEEFQRSYVPIPRTGVVARRTDPLLDLLLRYDLGKVEIGMITFLSDGVTDPKVRQVGKVEADPLLQDLHDGEVRVSEGDVRGRVLWRCAQDGGKFLDALAPAAAFLGVCAYDSDVSTNNALRQAKADECALSAGGSDYSAFYRMLLGCE